MKGLAIRLSSLSFICLLSLLAAQTSSSDAANSSNWPQWRGPDAQGVSNDKNPPTEWNVTKNVLWKAAIPGKGFSQPIIWGKKVFLTTDIEGGPEPTGYKPPKRIIGDKEFTHPDWDGVDKLHTFKTLCLDRDTGKILWEQTSYEGRVYDYRHKRGNYAAPTPVTDGKYVYSYFGSEGVYCYGFNGKLIWKQSLGNNGGILTCLNAKTGEVVYEDGRVPVATKFYGASPVAFDGKLLLTSDDGDTFVIKAGPQHEVLGTNSIGEPCRTSIAIADGKLFIRGEKHLFCIGIKG